MKKQISRIFFVIIVIIGGLSIFIISLKPSTLGTSEERLLEMVGTEFIYHDVVFEGQRTQLDQVVETNEHIFTLNSIRWNNDKDIACIIYTTKTPVVPSLTIFGNTIAQSKSVGEAHLIDAMGIEVEHKEFGFATDALDTVSFLICYKNMLTHTGDFVFTIGQADIPDKYAEFSINVPK